MTLEPDPRTSALAQRLALPIICAPMFIVSYPALVLAQCKAGVVGSFPALNARPKELLEEWLVDMGSELDQYRRAHPERRVAPFAVNQIVHPTNDRLAHDFALCVKHRVEIVITSGLPAAELVQEVHAYGGLVIHAVTNLRHAERALREGVDGLSLVAVGAGGHAGTLSPFALVSEARRLCAGPLALAGAISDGAQVLAALAAGADFAYVGTRFIATTEANATQEYKRMVLASSGGEIVYTPFFTGLPGNYLGRRIAELGLDPAQLGQTDRTRLNVKAWKDVWTAGHGVGAITDLPSVADLVGRMAADYARAAGRVAVLARGLPAAHTVAAPEDAFPPPREGVASHDAGPQSQPAPSAPNPCT